MAVLLPCLEPLGNMGVVTPGAIGCIGALMLAMLAMLANEAPEALRCMALVIARVA